MRRALPVVICMLLAACSDNTLSNEEIVKQRAFCHSKGMEVDYDHDMNSRGPVKVICVDPHEVWWNATLNRYEGNKP